MSNSQHPIALRIERQVGSNRLLATVMALPLVDGIFPALVLAGFLDTASGVIQVGLLVFGGSATVAVVLAELEDPRAHLGGIAVIGLGLVAAAALEAALAPTIAGVLDLVVFERFAALVILAVAATTASARLGDLLPRPAVIVGLGLVASLDLGGAAFVLALDPGLILRAGAAAGIAGAFALALAVLAPTLRGWVDIDRFRFGSAVALGMLPLALLGVIPTNAPLAVLGLSAVLAVDPESIDDERSTSRGPEYDDGAAGSETAVGEPDDRPVPGDGRAPWL